jgi:fatty-acyl-CoA synthase
MTGLYERLAAHVAARPAAPALVFEGATLSYAQFDAQVDQWRSDLAAAGIARGRTVGWLGHNSPDALAALFACARLGARFLPLNWRLAAPELVALARHGAVDVLQVRPELAALGAAVRAGLASPTARPPAMGQPPQPAGAGLPGQGGDDLLLVYTSGTTGTPKGALHPQAAMVANIDAALAVQGIDAATRVLAVLPTFHVGGLCIQVLPALAAGACVNLQARFEPAAWLRDVATWRAHTSLLVPAVMRALIEHPGWAAADLSSLRFVNSGSQIVPLHLIERFHARGVPVAQVYGSTETGPVSIALAPEEALAHAGSTGRPVPGVDVRLVDAEGRPVGEGEVGEIQVRGANVMRGYLGEPPLAEAHEGWFASGDLARRDAAGRYTVVGRSKDLIISGGENIHPDEIEQLAAAQPGVADAAVVGLPDERWGEVPVLVLVAQPGASIDEAALRAVLAERLARFKQPRRIVVLPALPRTALGKVRKSALQASLALEG